MILALLLWLAQATPGKDFSSSPNHDWFKSLKQPQSGVSCCDVSDCHRVEARTSSGHWEALIDGKWVRVPEDKILANKDNPTGGAVGCWANFPQEILWYCFVVPAMI